MPTIPFAEPVSPRYIHVNPMTNHIHLLVPLVGGQEISTDNTCKKNMTLKYFFEQSGALNALNAYKNALTSDIRLLEMADLERKKKTASLSS